MTTAKNSLFIVCGALLALLVPFIAMQFTETVNWSVADFVIAFALLAGAGLAFELIVAKIHSKPLRYLAIALTAVAFLLIWVELAVGIFH